METLLLLEIALHHLVPFFFLSFDVETGRCAGHALRKAKVGLDLTPPQLGSAQRPLPRLKYHAQVDVVL